MFGKVNIAAIVARHFESVFERPDKKWPVPEAITFLLLPIVFGALAALEPIKLSDSAMADAVTVYSIFGALLLSVQVALFTILRSERNGNIVGEKGSEDARRKVSKRLGLLRELNTNISYGVLLCIISSTLVLGFVVLTFPYRFETFVLVSLLGHFLATLIMITKRAFVMFDQEYS